MSTPRAPHVRTVPFDAVGTTGDGEDLLALLPDLAPLAWVRGGEGLVGWGEAARYEIPPGEDRFTDADDWLRSYLDGAVIDDEVRVFGTGAIAFATFTFDRDSAGSVLVIPRVLIGRRGGRVWVTTVDDAHPRPARTTPTAPTGVEYSGDARSAARYLAAVRAAVDTIAMGTVDKVVLSRDLRLTARNPLDPREPLRRLVRRYPECYTFAVDGLIGATPELLLRRHGAEIASLVLAGSIGRDHEPARDAELGRTLLGSAKYLREHDLAVESVRAALQAACIELDVDGSPSLLRLANLQHLATSVRGRLAPSSAAGKASVLELVGALHPTGAVCGTPRQAAARLIAELEGSDRGRYAGPVGWVDAEGNGEFGIALRCAQIAGRTARLLAGGGIVADSVPQVELEEAEMKLRVMRYAFG